jgi:uncharacterized protein (DUF1810 family)
VNDDPHRLQRFIDAQGSSMTLFARAAPDEPLFRQVLDVFFGGEADEATNRALA